MLLSFKMRPSRITMKHSPGGHDGGTADIPYNLPEPPGGGARAGDSTPE